MKTILPQITVNEYLLEIWPIDKWSREKTLSILHNNNIEYTLEATTMGEPSFKLRNKLDYTRTIKLIRNEL